MRWRPRRAARVGGVLLYVKFIPREGCLVVSFHGDENGANDDEESA